MTNAIIGGRLARFARQAPKTARLHIVRDYSIDDTIHTQYQRTTIMDFTIAIRKVGILKFWLPLSDGKNLQSSYMAYRQMADEHYKTITTGDGTCLWIDFRAVEAFYATPRD